MTQSTSYRVLLYGFGGFLVLIIGVVGWTFLSGYSWMRDLEAPQESPYEQIKRLRVDAAHKASETCSNNIVGITRIVTLNVSDWEDNTAKWTAEAAVEHVNRFGGIERTNLPLRFFTFADHRGQRQISAVVDQAELARRRQPRY